MIAAFIKTFSVAMIGPYSADVSMHLQRCREPSITVDVKTHTVSLSCGQVTIKANCSSKNKKQTVSLFDKNKLYIGHIECRRN